MSGPGVPGPGHRHDPRRPGLPGARVRPRRAAAREGDHLGRPAPRARPRRPRARSGSSRPSLPCGVAAFVAAASCGTSRSCRCCRRSPLDDHRRWRRRRVPHDLGPCATPSSCGCRWPVTCSIRSSAAASGWSSTAASRGSPARIYEKRDGRLTRRQPWTRMRGARPAPDALRGGRTCGTGVPIPADRAIIERRLRRLPGAEPWRVDWRAARSPTPPSPGVVADRDAAGSRRAGAAS